MDAPVIFSIVLFMGLVKILKSDAVKPTAKVVNRELPESKEEIKGVLQSIPIGNNLTLNKETGAFMKIVDEMGLR